jgi:glycosyltransferase involved in cell wall biosynthesis
MRFGIDIRGIQRFPDGIGRYTRSLVRGLLDIDDRNEYVLFKRPETDLSDLLPSGGGSPGPRLPEQRGGRESGVPRVETIDFPFRHLSLGTVFLFGRVVRAARVDLLHIPFFVGPFFLTVPTVVTVHDLMALTFPGFFSGRGWLSEKMALVFHKCFASRTVRHGHLIFADSEYTKQEIIRVIGVPESRIEVVYPSLDHLMAGRVGKPALPCTGGRTFLSAFAGRVGKPALPCEGGRTFLSASDRRVGKPALPCMATGDPYFVYLGNTKPYKNIPGLLQGLALVRERLSVGKPGLIFIGREDRFREAVESEVYRLGLADCVTFAGELEDTRAGEVLRGSVGFCFPSLSEGFGLPVLEAMSLGVPVLTSRAASLPEVAGDAALLVDPENPEEIADGMFRLLREPDLRQDLSEKGLRRAEYFSERRMAEKTLGLYRTICRNLNLFHSGSSDK